MAESEWRGRFAPDLAEIETLAESARSRLPEPFASAARAVVLRVEDLADDATLDALGIEDPFELTGLYDGIPLTQKSLMDVPQQPDAIWLFRAAILDEWVARGDVALDVLVTHVFVHELAHHLGWSDADIARIDRWWE
ncbi:MAG: metallopeptidase family protein [Rhodobacter sp.]|uniref:metallopeptidase family protein n=1 Tax=Pararhodobacter sp. TaxID=2127056 RepID=UPI001D548905|nr:metallopeptidase family protein [Pararhodobacter sp.]MCB1346353.1 metallopeptidase family protein [Paracoccaceae bacterium]MCC0073611.1 metallopeptidase family protein [Rhodobacter sp.]HPD91722.1 metallopeptidase family protein [Pararhodobacter sp.]